MVDDELFNKLAATRAAFEDADDPADRDRLEAELTELRRQVSASTRGGLDTMTDEQLDREIARLERELTQLHERKLNPSMAAAASGRGGGFDPLELQKHNQRIDKQGDRAGLERALVELREESVRRRSHAT